MVNHISYEDIGFDRDIIDCSEDSKISIPIGMSEQGIYDLTFRSGYMYRSQAMSCYMIHGAGLADEIILQSILLNGCKRYTPSNLNFWIYSQKEDRFNQIAASGLPHIERVITLSSEYEECLRFWEDLRDLAEERFLLFQALSNKIGNCIFEIGQYNREVRKVKDFGAPMPRIIALVNMDDFLYDIYKGNRRSLFDKIELCLRRLTHAAKQGIYIVFTANRFFFRFEHVTYTILSQVVNCICTRTQDLWFLNETNFEKAFNEKEVRSLIYNECFIATGTPMFGDCQFDDIPKVTIADCDEPDAYIRKIQEMYPDRVFDKIKGCLYGGAVGDAFGAPVEFLLNFLILKKYGTNGITELKLYDTKNGKKALVTDDTQMTLFTLAGILDALDKYKAPTQSEYKNCIYESYLSWLTTQENFTLPANVAPSSLLQFEELKDTRAPGDSCLSALRYGHMGSVEARINNSKGCGGIMRVAPIGFLTTIKNPLSIKEIGMLGAEVSALTHCHELGYTSSAFLAMMIAHLLQGQSIVCAVSLAKTTLLELFPEANHMDRLMGLVDNALKWALSEDTINDVEAIEKLGAGWIAEETLAIAIYCSVRHSNDFEKAIIAAVNHSGDSDSTGAVTGNILGAYMGYDKIPDKFKGSIDVENVIEYAISKWATME